MHFYLPASSVSQFTASPRRNRAKSEHYKVSANYIYIYIYMCVCVCAYVCIYMQICRYADMHSYSGYGLTSSVSQITASPRRNRAQSEHHKVRTNYIDI